MEMLYKLRCLGFVEIDDDIWFANLYFNALVRLNRRTGKIEDLKKFPDYGIDRQWLYATVCHVKEYLVFIPFRSEAIVSYNMQTQEFISTALDLDKVGKRERYFASAFEYGNYVYMFPVEAECIIRFDVQQNAITYLFYGLHTISNRLPETAERFALQFEVVDGKIYMPFAECNAVAVFDPEKENLNIQDLPIKGGCSTINYHNGFFYMASWKTCKIYRWNTVTGEIIVYEKFPQNFQPGEYTFLGGWIMGDKIFYLPIQGNRIVSLDMETGELYEDKKIYNTYNEVWRIFYGKKIGESLHIGLADKDNFCILDYKDGKSVIKQYFRQETFFNRAVINIFFLEHGYLDIFREHDKKKNDYMAIIMNSRKKKTDRGNDTFGKLIWKNL